MISAERAYSYSLESERVKQAALPARFTHSQTNDFSFASEPRVGDVRFAIVA